MVLDVICFILCLLITIGQMAILDFYFLHYMKDDIWYAWIAGDALVIIVYIALLVVAIKYNQRCMNEVCTSDANIQYAFLGWLVYSGVLVGKVVVTFRTFYKDLRVTPPVDSNDGLEAYFGQHTYKLTLALSAIIFLLLVEAHHYTQLNSPRQLYLTYLSSVITLDLLDSIMFLELLWDRRVRGFIDFPLEISILVFACLNFVLPTFALLKLRFRKMPRWLPLPYEKLYALIYVLVVNVPYLVIRAWVWRHVEDHDTSIFIIKNVIMIYLAIREVWTKFQLHRQKKATATGELTAITSEEAEKATHHN